MLRLLCSQTGAQYQVHPPSILHWKLNAAPLNLDVSKRKKTPKLAACFEEIEADFLLLSNYVPTRLEYVINQHIASNLVEWNSKLLATGGKRLHAKIDFKS